MDFRGKAGFRLVNGGYVKVQYPKSQLFAYEGRLEMFQCKDKNNVAINKPEDWRVSIIAILRTKHKVGKVNNPLC